MSLYLQCIIFKLLYIINWQFRILVQSNYNGFEFSFLAGLKYVIMDIYKSNLFNLHVLNINVK